MTEAEGWEELERLLWPEGPRCPLCGSDHVTYLVPHNRVSRATRTGTQSQRRVWKCNACHQQFSATTGTPYQGTKIPAPTLVAIIRDGELLGTVRENAPRYGLNPSTIQRLKTKIALHPGSRDRPAPPRS